MSSPTSTSFDFAASESSGISPQASRVPSVISNTTSTSASVTLSRHYACDILTVFKVEDKLFRFDRRLLDEETDTIPRGVGSKEDPILLKRIKAADFEILLDFLKRGTRHDEKPLTVFDLTSIIAVCTILGIQRVQNLACETFSDQHKTVFDEQKELLDLKTLVDQQKTLLNQQKTLLDQQNAPSKVSYAGLGFDRAACGLYFLIREKGTANYLITSCRSDVEGVQLHLWPQEIAGDKYQIFFIDSSGALCHAASGLAVDIIDDVPILRRRRPVYSDPNPWSRPLPEFSFVNSQIRVNFLSDPSLPRCTDDLYPDNSWATKQFLLAAHPEKDFHMHPISEFSAWIPTPMAGTFNYNTSANHDEKWRALVEERTEDVGGERTSWEIVPASKMAARNTQPAIQPPLLPDVPSIIMSAVGKFNTTEVRSSWPNTTAETRKSIAFSRPFVAPPGLPIGLNALDIDGGSNIRVKSFASDITKNDFVVHVDCWSDTKIYSAGVSWLEVAPGDLECQHGQFNTIDDHRGRQAKTSRRINFVHPYATSPKVISFLTSFDMGRNYTWRVMTKVTDIDKKGFTIHIDTWGDTILYQARAGWIAYPEDRPFFYSGTANVMDVRVCDNPVANNSKAITFRGTQFCKTPSVFIALNSLDIANGHNLRLRASVDNVSASGLTWHIDTWGDSVLYGGGISYLAFCDRAGPAGGGDGGGGGFTAPPLRP